MAPPLPADYVTDYSPLSEADLVVHVIEESAPSRRYRAPSLVYRGLRRILRSPDWNDSEAEKAWTAMREKGEETTPRAIVRFLREKFAHDHLRKLEYPFQAECLAQLDLNGATVIDMGGGSSYSTVVPLLFRFPGVSVWSLDVQEHGRSSQLGVRYLVGDCTSTDLDDESVDVVCLISALEHVGLGRWGDPLDVNGDIRAMEEAKRVLKRGGHVILTVPYGYPTVVFNLHRVYDAGRFSLLCAGFDVIRVEYNLFGRVCSRERVEGQRVTKHIPGYNTIIPEEQRLPEAPGGVLALLKKRDHD